MYFLYFLTIFISTINYIIAAVDRPLTQNIINSICSKYEVYIYFIIFMSSDHILPRYFLLKGIMKMSFPKGIFLCTSKCDVVGLFNAQYVILAYNNFSDS